MFDWLQELHSSQGIARLVEAGGLFALIGIIFAETGLLVGFFLPGDSLLITAGVLANPANTHHIETLSIIKLNLLLVVAAIVGDQLGYYLGWKSGSAIWTRPDGRFFKKKYLRAAYDFYQRHGGIAVVAARYLPVFRTFVPFAAGMARMSYGRFLFWNVFGGVLWITSLLWIGYYLGQTALANRLDKILILVVFVSILPMVIAAARRYLNKRKNSEALMQSEPSS